MTHHPPLQVAFEHPANAGVVRHLRSVGSVSVARDTPSRSPDAVDDPYMNLGTHPDLVLRLWQEITKDLPARCDWVVYGAPALVRPDSGIVFGYAGGTHTYALRLPPAERAEVSAAALRRANALADEHGLSGQERDRYVRLQSGNVREYSDGSDFDLAV